MDSPFRRLVMWLRALVRRNDVETEMDREMRAHLELETEANVRAGMSADDARRAALVAFGGVERVKEDVREERGTLWLEQALSDFRLALRGFRRQPTFAFTVALLLALGIGANAAIFSVVHRLLISPLPFPDGNRMVTLFSSAGSGITFQGTNAGFTERWRSSSRMVSEVVVLERRSHVIGDTSAIEAEAVTVLAFSPGALGFTGTRPIIGRDIVSSDTAGGADPVALLSHETWLRRFSGDSNALGKTLALDGRLHTIIGVLPPKFSVPFTRNEYRAFTPLRITGPRQRVEPMAKLRAGHSVQDANRELESLWAAEPAESRGELEAPKLMRATDFVGSHMRDILVLLFVAVGVVLLIACANVANLMLARAWSRHREFAIRAAIGAGRGRLMRQVFAESVLLAMVGGVIGVGIAWLTLQGLAALEPPNESLKTVTLGTAVLWWSAGLTMLAAFLFGTAPALVAGRGHADEALKEGTRTATGGRIARRLRSGLVTAEVALSVTLLVGAGLIIRSMAAMQQADVGFDPGDLSSVRVEFPKRAFPDSVLRRSLVEEALAKVREIPGVEAATYVASPPPRFMFAFYSVEIEGRVITPDDSLHLLNTNSVRPDFFRVARIPFTSGRPPSPNPLLTNALGSGEVVVNEAFARRFWPEGDAVGRKLRLAKQPWATIVGVVPDVRMPRAHSVRAQFYHPIPAAPDEVYVLVRSPLSSREIGSRVQSAVREVNASVRVGEVTTLMELIAEGRAQHRFTLSVLGAFAVLACLLATFGLHAVISYAVTQRTREMGVRMALGARSVDVTRMVVGQGLFLAVGGVALGLVAALAGVRLLKSLLYGVGPTDPPTLIVVTAIMTGAAALAAYLPARRAARVDPATVLRSQ